MGGHAYWYVVPYQADVQAALDSLREREFKAGRYSPVMRYPPFPVGPDSPAPGAKHRTIAEALEATETEGTRSILDLDRIADTPGHFRVTPLDPATLEEHFGTTKPTLEMVEENTDFFEDIERGEGIYIVLYDNGEPSELFFAGYSFD